MTLIDSPEVLDLLPNPHNIIKLPGAFPGCLRGRIDAIGPFHAILAYSVAQIVFAEADLFAFVDFAAGLLEEGGTFLIGDISNISMRKRFLASASGRAYHREHYPDVPEPVVTFNVREPGRIDDAVILALLARMRAAGFQAFVVPQAADLPYANRREDILIQRI